MEAEADLTPQPYDEYWKRRKKSGFRHRFGVIAGWIIPASNVFDAGCGDGALGEYLVQTRQCVVTGLDVSMQALDTARKRGLTVVQGSLSEPLPFPDNSFDYAVASEALEHIPNSEEALQELIRVAKVAVLVSVPNTGYWRDRLSLLAGRFPKQWIHQPWEHVRFWTIGDFTRMLDRLGLHATRVEAGSGRRWLRNLWPSLFARQVCYYVSKN